MLSSKTDRYGRRVQDRGNPTLSQDAVKLFKTQDAGYLKTMIQQTRKTRAKVEQQCLLSDQGVHGFPSSHQADSGQHLIFAGTSEEQQFLCNVESQHISTSTTDGLYESVNENNLSVNRSLKGERRIDHHQVALKKGSEDVRRAKQEMVLRKLRKRQRANQQSRLRAFRLREKDLLAAEQQLDQGRARMSGSVGGVNRAGIRWKTRERRR